MSARRLAIVFAALASPAVAGPVSPEGTARLTEVFQTYLGRTPGVVSVQPGDGVYDVRIDVSPLAAMIPGEGVRLEADPVLFTLQDNGDGTWDYVRSQRDWEMAVSVPGVIDYTSTTGEVSSSGLFDEALMGFASFSSLSKDIAETRATVTPDQPARPTSTHVAEQSCDSTSEPSGEGGVDTVSSSRATNMTLIMAMPAPGDPDRLMDIKVTVDHVDTAMAMSRVNMPEIFGLWAWVVAHPSSEAIVRDQTELKRLLSGTLPVFDRLEGTLTVGGIGAATPVGEFSADSAEVSFAVGGIVTDGFLREGVSVSGLTIPEGLMPDWAAGLVPGDSSIGFEVTGFDLATPLATLLPALDLGDPDLIDGAVVESALPQLLPTGAVRIALTPGGTTAPLYALTYEGTTQAGPGLLPTGRATIAMTGLDAVVDALNAAGLTAQDGVGPALAMARGLGRRGADGALVWDIDVSDPDKVLVNGTDLLAAVGSLR